MYRCIRCEGELEKGFMLDNGHYNATSQAQWASGTPKKSFWHATVVGAGERKLAVVTYRCKACGRLESFAPNAA